MNEPIVITILFRVTDEGVAMLYLRGVCDDTQTFLVTHVHDGLPFPSRPLGNGVVMMLPVTDSDDLLITVSNHYGRIEGCIAGEINTSLSEFDKVLSIRQQSDMLVKQTDLDEEKMIERVVTRVMQQHVFPGEVA